MTAARERLVRYLVSTGWIAPSPEEVGEVIDRWRHPSVQYLMPVPRELSDDGLDWEMIAERLAMIEDVTVSEILARLRDAKASSAVASLSDLDTDTKTSELDRLLGIDKALDPVVVGQLQRVHREHRRDARRFKSAVIRQVVFVVTIMFLIITSVLMIGSLIDFAAPPTQSSWEHINRAWRHSYGAVTPGLALVVNTTLLALVASINIALAAATSRGNRNDDTITSLWGEMLRWCALVAGGSAQVFSILQLKGLGDQKVDHGTVAAAFLVGLLAAFLSITLVEYSNTAVRARDLVDAEKQRREICDWIDLIRARGVPISIPAGHGLRLKHLPKIPRIVAVGFLLPIFALVYTYAAMELIVWGHRGQFFIPSSGRDIQLALYAVGYSAGITYIVGMFTWQRWSTRKARFIRLRMTVWPLIFRFLYVVTIFGLMTLLSMKTPEDWVRGIIVATAMSGPFIVLPCAAWTALWLSRKVTLRRGSDNRVAGEGWVGKLVRCPGDFAVWLAAPIWQNVSKSLEDYYRNNTKRRDEAHDDEVELINTQRSAVQHSALSVKVGEM